MHAKGTQKYYHLCCHFRTDARARLSALNMATRNVFNKLIYWYLESLQPQQSYWKMRMVEQRLRTVHVGGIMGFCQLTSRIFLAIK